jgi:hypothetical protein
MEAPTKIIKFVRNIEFSFLWGGPKIERKWSLVVIVGLAIENKIC